MPKTDLSRRDFSRLTAAALGGVVAGTMVGCDSGGDSGSAGMGSSGGGAGAATASGGGTGEGAAGSGTGAAAGSELDAETVALLTDELHVCRGLNVCKGQGADKQNECAGRGTCANVAHHECGTQNECKGQGGCGGKHGTNACKGQGGCAVPLAHGWEGVRAKFELAMKSLGKEVGPAPAAP